MSASLHRRQHRAWITGAGLACLSAGGVALSGCTTPSTADLKLPAKKSQQVARSSASSAGTAPAPKLASQDEPGKARITDQVDPTQTRVVAKKSTHKSDGSQSPASTTRRQQTQLASTSSTAQKPAARKSVSAKPDDSKSDVLELAARKRKSAATPSDETLSASVASAEALADRGSIKQTAAKGQSPLHARKKAAEPKRPAAQQPIPAPKAEDDEPDVASSHERRRADRLMERAHESYRNGYPEQSLRLAAVAFELEKSRQAIYRRNEERPSDYITWLQSVALADKSTPPVIRPQQPLDRQPVNTHEAASVISAAGAEGAEPGRPGDVIRANVTPNDPHAAGTPSEIRSNVGVDLAASDSPRFTTADQGNPRVGANAGQVEVPVPPQPRSTDARMAATNAGGQSVDAPSVPEPNRAVENVDRHQSKAAAAALPQPASEISSRMPEPADMIEADVSSETEAFAESETAGVIPTPTSQLTIASLVGLVTGIAGMFGLTWWRHQERRHYAAGK